MRSRQGNSISTVRPNSQPVMNKPYTAEIMPETQAEKRLDPKATPVSPAKKDRKTRM